MRLENYIECNDFDPVSFTITSNNVPSVMAPTLQTKIRKRLRLWLQNEISKILQDLEIPSSEEWSAALNQYADLRNKLSHALAKELVNVSEQKSVHIFVEDQYCEKCSRPHFQGGLCLLHFHQRYSIQLERSPE